MASSQQESDIENVHLISHQDEDEIEEKEVDCSNSQFLRWKKSLFQNTGLIIIVTSIALICICILLLVLITLFLYHPDSHQPSENSPSLPGTRFGSCGDSPSSAREANCTFDAMSFSWLPSQCADPELTTEFLQVRNWTWWKDGNKTTAIPYEEVATGNHQELFVTREYHMYHCTYMWRKLHRGILKGQENAENRGLVDTYIGSYKHTDHCEMMLLGMEEEHGVVDKTATDTHILMKFVRCMWI